tara:strand:- start:2716 stop:3108 length:393 start_codon:yes stop_codon:yes gene_type:complete
MELKQHHKKAARMLASERYTRKEVAEAAGVTVMSISRWLKDLDFSEELHLLRRQNVRDNSSSYVQGRIDGLILAAIDALDRLMRDGESETAIVRAACYILDRYHQPLGEGEETRGIDELRQALRVVTDDD